MRSSEHSRIWCLLVRGKCTSWPSCRLVAVLSFGWYMALTASGQATIEYVQYLEDCITQLKAQNQTISQPAQTPGFLPSSYTRHTSPDDDAEAISPPPTLTTSNSRQQHASASPIVDPQLRKDSISSASSDHRDPSYSVSATTSPVFGPQAQHRESFGSALTSPALEPQRNVDHEVTSALLTLSQADRRAPGYFSGRGMSVRDLLTS